MAASASPCPTWFVVAARRTYECLLFWFGCALSDAFHTPQTSLDGLPYAHRAMPRHAEQLEVRLAAQFFFAGEASPPALKIM